MDFLKKLEYILSGSSSVGIRLSIKGGILGLKASLFLRRIGIGDTKFDELFGDEIGLLIRFEERGENFAS